MPHTLPPAVIETTAVHPVLPSDKEIHYTTGDTITATHDDSAQDASYEADLERAIRRSERDHKELERSASQSHSRSESHHRGGLNRIRAAIKEIVDDPFWHRPTKEEANDPEYMHRIILEEVAAARASTDAGSRDRQARHASRSRSRVRSPFAASPPTSQPGSRSQSRVRQIVGSMLGGSGGSHDRGAAGFGHVDKEADVPATVKK
ncbi:hypothetical protein JCM5296_007311 [Sporobolomyces johnsonii]